jgi:hypothetical protein
MDGGVNEQTGVNGEAEREKSERHGIETAVLLDELRIVGRHILGGALEDDG